MKHQTRCSQPAALAPASHRRRGLARHRWSGPLFIDETPIARGTRVVIVGEVDIATAAQMDAALQDAVGNGEVVEVDMSDVSFMDSQGVAVLIETRRQLAPDQTLRIVNPSRIVTRVLAALDLEAHFGAQSLGR